MAIYLDHNATSPMHPEVADAMMPFLQNPTESPSSLHSYGRMARPAIEPARAEVANLLGCSSEAIIFTSGGTEANNMLLKGSDDGSSERAIVSSEIEHPSILESLRQLQADRQNVIRVKSDCDGQIDPDTARQAILEIDPQLPSVTFANNETGVTQPVESLASMVDRDSCLEHSDATQAVGRIPADMSQLDVDTINFSAHNLRGPQGVGGLVVNKKPKNVLIGGGYQENRRRGGTKNVAGIVGLGKAAQIAGLEMEHKKHHLGRLKVVFESRLATIPGGLVFGQRSPRLPSTTYFALPYYHGETLLMELDRAGFALSSGSACHSTVTDPSHVLSAMWVEDNLALNAIRVSFGMQNNPQDIEAFVAKLLELANKLPGVMRQAVG